MINYKEILNTFEPIGLDEMGSVKLMDRVDDKYLLHIDNLSKVLSSAAADYKAVVINGERIMGYESLYFDTPDHLMYILHHNKKLNRYKIRIRQYLDSQEYFLEIKFKNNKGQTKKKRIKVDGNHSISDPESKSFIAEVSPFTVDQIEPKLYTSFNRITLVNTEKKERITLDLNLTLHNKENSITIPYLVIAEVKHEKGSGILGFGKLLQEHRIFPKRMSKYCAGTNLLYPEIKHNRFKPKMIYLKKLDNTKHYDKLYSAII